MYKNNAKHKIQPTNTLNKSQQNPKTKIKT